MKKRIVILGIILLVLFFLVGGYYLIKDRFTFTGNVISGCSGGNLIMGSNCNSITKIMSIGDSITEGSSYDTTYRYWLWDKLVTENYFGFDFVGPFLGNRSGLASNVWIDADHFGNSGWTADQILNGNPSQPERKNLKYWAPVYKPDIALIHIGINDFHAIWWEYITNGVNVPSQTVRNNTIFQTANETMAIISELRKSNPYVKILLAKITPSVLIPNEDVERYNTLLGSLASVYSSSDSPIIMVDLYDGYNNNLSSSLKDSIDGVHPNSKGSKKNADKWFNALSFISNKFENPLLNQQKVLGVDYHSIGNSTNSWGEDAFLVQYNNATIRSKVLSQLDQFKSEGVTRISTRIWFAYGQNDPYFPGIYHHHFPLTNQELINIKNYAQDVADRNLTLSFVLLFLSCNNYLTGSPSTLLGDESCPAASRTNGNGFIVKFGQSVNGLLDNVKNIKRSDGARVVDRIYFSGELILDGNGANPNTQWVFYDSGLWTWFYNTVSASGIIPTTYFMAIPFEDARATGDSDFPALNNHWTMERLYRTVKWMKDRDLPLPERIDFDFYLTKEDGSLIDPNNYAPLIKKTLDDFEAIIPPLLGKYSVDYSIEEHDYFKDPYHRYLNQKAWKENFYRSNLKGINIWTSPYRAGTGGLIPPLDFNLFLNSGRTGLITANPYICTNFDANNLCSTNIFILSVEPAEKIMFLTVINPDSGSEILVGCRGSSFNSSISWIQKNKNYTFILYTLNSLDVGTTCSAGNSLLTNSNKLVLDRIVISGKEINSAPICTSFNYSSWSQCNSSALQSRTITSRSPSGCVDGTADSLIKQCSPPCLESNWQSINSVCLSSNVLIRNWTKIGNCNQTIGISKSVSENVACTYDPNTIACIDFSYSDWNECLPNGIQNRSLISFIPINCSGGNPVLIQTCNYTSAAITLNPYSAFNLSINEENSSLNNNSSLPQNVFTSLQNESTNLTNRAGDYKQESRLKLFWNKFICSFLKFFNRDRVC